MKKKLSGDLKLRLHRETLHALDVPALEAAAGADAPVTFTCNNTCRCPTNGNCTTTRILNCTI